MNLAKPAKIQQSHHLGSWRTKPKKIKSVSWIVKGVVLAKGVGMEVENNLAVGWRRVKD